MSRGWRLGVLTLAWLMSGCCAQPGIFQKLTNSLQTVQSFYTPLLQENFQDDKVRRAVVAADTALLLAAELQSQWCPDPQAVAQAELQLKNAAALAQEAGVTATQGNPSPAGSDKAAK